VIRFEQVSVTYDGADRPVLHDVSLHVPEGELCLVIGPTGSGKSTLLGAVNGLVPRFTGGTLAGTVTVAGRRTDQWPPRELADVVGLVGQNPAAGFVTDVVEDELAYVMENLGIDPATMRRRVEDVLDLLGLHELRNRPLASLSGGQQQRVAIGSVLTAGPRVLVLDEPTSALDPGAAEEVLAALTRLVHDLGITVLLAEHRLERVVHYADRVALLDGSGRMHTGLPADVLAEASVVPPVVELAQLARWSPVPLSVRDARRRAPELRMRLNGGTPPGGPPPADLADARPDASADEPAVVDVRGLVASYGAIPALRNVDLSIGRGEIVAVMGRNGAGKSTLLAHLAGLRAPAKGRVQIEGYQPHALDPKRGIRVVGMVPQDPGLLLYHDTVAAECTSADHDAGLLPGRVAEVLTQLVGPVDENHHPRDLSEGQRLGLALAIVLGAEPPLVLLDEPTRGLDYSAKARLVTELQRLAADGHTVVLATHDVEVAAQVAHRVVVLAEGEVVADGPAREVVAQSPVFAPQVAKILAPDAWLTVDEVRVALARGEHRSVVTAP
jgi:energy-coupling factor transport system ATP-binding protein